MAHDPTPPHPLLVCADAIEAALKEAAGVDPIFMTLADKRVGLVRFAHLVNLVEAVRMRVIAAAEDVAAAEGHRDVASWLTHRTRADRGSDRRAQRLAVELDTRWHQLAAAVQDPGEGRVNLDQAHVIARALGDVSRALAEEPGVGADQRADILAKAEVHLIEQAADFGPKELKRLGARILDVVAPEFAEEANRRSLEAQEAHARRHTTLTTQALGDGTTLIKARVPDQVAVRLVTHLEAFTNPRRAHLANGGAEGAEDSGCGALAAAGYGADGEKLPYPMRLGNAFCSLLESLDPKRLPLHGGDATRIVVTIPVDQLTSGLGAGTLPDGTRMTVGEVRRLACTAGIVPAVLGTDSHVLDLGRTVRLHNGPQRTAMGIRDKHCRADGCRIPATWCEAHHLVPWSEGGVTSADAGVLLCAFHHHLIHDPRYHHTRLANGDIRFTKRGGRAGSRTRSPDLAVEDAHRDGVPHDQDDQAPGQRDP